MIDILIFSYGTFREADENELTTTVAVAMLAVVQPTPYFWFKL
jgi:hypothetical protein